MNSEKETILTEENISQVVHNTRKEESLTLRELSNKTGITPQTFCNLEKHGTNDIGLKKFIKTANALDREVVMRKKQQKV